APARRFPPPGAGTPACRPGSSSRSPVASARSHPQTCGRGHGFTDAWKGAPLMGYELPDPDALDKFAGEWEGVAQDLFDLSKAVKTAAATPQWSGKAH